MPDLAPLPPHMIGPTWQRLEEGGFHLPEHSLGYDIVNWMFTYLKQPNGPHAGDPFIPTNEQFRFLLWWYAVGKSGRYEYRKGIFRRMKGHGKDPLAAAMSLVELCGPVVFDRWDNGKPIGKPRSMALIQVAAVSQEQTKNTFAMFAPMATKRFIEEYGVELNKTVIYTEAGGTVEAVTASPYAMEGRRPTFVIKNETQWWMENNSGHEMSNVIQGNVDKASYGGCRVLSICNAHRPGEESDAERDWEAYQAVVGGDAVDTGVLYDALEAPADTPVSEIGEIDQETEPEKFEAAIQKLREGLLVARGDSVWLPVDTILESILDTKNDVTESRRKFLNQINASEDSWMAPREWDAIADTTLKLEPKDRITLGFDGSKGNDWTALVACRVDDGAVFLIKAWNPDKYEGQIPREQVNSVVEWAFEQYEVVAFRADVREFESYIDQWGVRYGKKLKVKATPGHAVAFDMRTHTKQFTLDCERFEDSVLDKTLVHDGNVTLRQHVLNAHRRWNNHGVAIGKATKDSSRKIDAAVCAVLAVGARQEFLMSKKNRSRKAVILR